ncbi:MAG TPA: methyltransferase domain-containing protein [Gemmatimonadaceae bacterium]
MTATNPGAAGHRPTFDDTADNYERHFVPVIGSPLAHNLVDAANLRPGERVLDVATGTGIVARLAARRVSPGGTVAGLDVSSGMLAKARSLAPADGVPIRWYETSAESVPLPDEQFDVVFCQVGLQFMADKLAALREMRRLLVPGGRLLISVPASVPLWERFEETLERHVPGSGRFVRLVFSLGDGKQLEQLLGDAGFGSVVVRTHTQELEAPAPRQFFWGYIASTPLAGMVPRPDDPRGAALERDAVAALQPWVQGDGMRFRQEAVVGTARR